MATTSPIPGSLPSATPPNSVASPTMPPADFNAFYSGTPQQKVQWLAHLGQVTGFDQHPNWNQAISGFINPAYGVNPASKAALQNYYNTQLYPAYKHNLELPTVKGQLKGAYNVGKNFVQSVDNLPSAVGDLFYSPLRKQGERQLESFLPTPSNLWKGINSPWEFAKHGEIGAAVASLAMIVGPSFLHGGEGIGDIGEETSPERIVPLARADTTDNPVVKAAVTRIGSPLFEKPVGAFLEKFNPAMMKGFGDWFKAINDPSFKQSLIDNKIADQFRDTSLQPGDNLPPDVQRAVLNDGGDAHMESLVQNLKDSVTEAYKSSKGITNHLYDDILRPAAEDDKGTYQADYFNDSVQKTLDNKIADRDVKRTLVRMAKNDNNTAAGMMDNYRRLGDFVRGSKGLARSLFTDARNSLGEDIKANLPSDLVDQWQKANNQTVEQIKTFSSPLVKNLLQGKADTALKLATKIFNENSPEALRGLFKVIGDDPKAMSAFREGVAHSVIATDDPPEAIIRHIEEHDSAFKMTFGDKGYNDLRTTLYSKLLGSKDPYMTAISAPDGGFNVKDGASLNKTLEHIAYTENGAKAAFEVVRDRPQLLRSAVSHILYRTLNDSVHGDGYFGDGRSVVDPVELGHNLGRALPQLKVFLDASDPGSIDRLTQFSNELKQADTASKIIRAQVSRTAGGFLESQTSRDIARFPSLVKSAIGIYGGMNHLFQYAIDMDDSSPLAKLMHTGKLLLHGMTGAIAARQAIHEREH